MNTKPLASIRVLYLRPDSLCLYGIPYDMRPGQSPRDIVKYKDHPQHGWIWLGSCGSYAGLFAERVAEIEAFLAAWKEYIPENPHEFCVLPKECCGVEV